MSVADEITKLKNNMDAAYDAVEEKGGTLPEEKTMSALADSVASITGGGTTFDTDMTFMEVQGSVLNGASGTIDIPAGSDVNSFYVNGWGSGIPNKFTGGLPITVSVTLDNESFTFNLPHTLRAASSGSMTDFTEESAYSASCMNQINYKTGIYTNWWADTNIDWASARSLAEDTTFNIYSAKWESIPDDHENALMSFEVSSTLSGWRIPLSDLGISGAMDLSLLDMEPMVVSNSQDLGTWVKRLVPSSRVNYSLASSDVIPSFAQDTSIINGLLGNWPMIDSTKLFVYIENGYMYFAHKTYDKTQTLDTLESLNLQFEYALKVPTETILPSSLTEYVNSNIIGHHDSSTTISYACSDISPISEGRGDGHYVKGVVTKSLDDYNIASTNEIWDIEMWYMEHGLDVHQDGVLWLQPKEVE